MTRPSLVGCHGAVVPTFTNSALKADASGRQNPGGGRIQDV